MNLQKMPKTTYKIVFLRQWGDSQRAISQKLGVSHHGVQCALKKLEVTEQVSDKIRYSRPNDIYHRWTVSDLGKNPKTHQKRTLWKGGDSISSGYKFGVQIIEWVIRDIQIQLEFWLATAFFLAWQWPQTHCSKNIDTVEHYQSTLLKQCNSLLWL